MVYLNIKCCLLAMSAPLLMNKIVLVMEKSYMLYYESGGCFVVSLNWKHLFINSDRKYRY